MKAQNGVKDVTLYKDVKPLTVTVRFDPQTVNSKTIGEVAKQALETDEHNTAPVELNYEKQ